MSRKLLPIGSKVSVFGSHKGILVHLFLAPDLYDHRSTNMMHYGVILLDQGHWSEGREIFHSNIIVNVDNLTLEA